MIVLQFLFLPIMATYRRLASSVTMSESRWVPNSECGKKQCSEQIHLQLGGSGEMVVVFATLDDETPSEVYWWEADGEHEARYTARGTVHASSQLLYVDVMVTNPAIGPRTASAEAVRALQSDKARPVPPGMKRPKIWSPPASNDGVSYGIGAYNNPDMFYDSPLLHTVAIGGRQGDGPKLRGGVTYRYTVAGDTREFSFTMPPQEGGSGDGGTPFPYLFALGADLGQTAAAEANIHLMRDWLSDGAVAGGTVLLAGDLSYADGWGSRWDSFARLMEPLAARFPVMTTGGNHEVGLGEAWVAYHARYPMPHAASRSPSNLWWSRDIGPAHVISLCSYAGSHPGSLQHRWLLRDLAKVDRGRTPWLVVMLHSPWYHSSSAHGDEASRMRGHMEEVLYEAGVDLVLAGHIHAYERTVPLFQGQENPCGPVYLTLGDGGNREGVSLPWLQPAPEWSAFREGSFGLGALQLLNGTHATFNWTRTACENRAAPQHIDLDGATCTSEALGPWDFGSDHPDRDDEQSHKDSRRRKHHDMAWIVRNLERSPRSAECGPRRSPVAAGPTLAVVNDGDPPAPQSVEAIAVHLDEAAPSQPLLPALDHALPAEWVHAARRLTGAPVAWTLAALATLAVLLAATLRMVRDGIRGARSFPSSRKATPEGDCPEEDAALDYILRV